MFSKVFRWGLWLVVFYSVVALGAEDTVKKKDAEDLLKGSFPLLYKKSILVNYEVLDGCAPQHFRGRFHWVLLGDLPQLNADGKPTIPYSEIASLPVPIRYGEFFFRVYEGRKLFNFHGYDFAEFFGEKTYGELCPKNREDATVICAPNELNFEKAKGFEKTPLVECLGD